MLYRRLKQKGQSLVEYALILALIALASIAILAVVGPSIGSIYSKVLFALTKRGTICTSHDVNLTGNYGNYSGPANVCINSDLSGSIQKPDGTTAEKDYVYKTDPGGCPSGYFGPNTFGSWPGSSNFTQDDYQNIGLTGPPSHYCYQGQ
jgi:pilus assembly protein Flp/PilA